MVSALQTSRQTNLQVGRDDRPTRLLLIEDDPDDVLLLRDTLADVAPEGFEWTAVDFLDEGVKQITSQPFDLALLDLHLPDSHGLETFVKLRSAAPGLPIVILTGLQDESIGLEAVQHGAQDYIVKGNVDGPLLVRSIRFAVERARRQEAEQALCARQAEVSAARAIQQRLFPQSAPILKDFDIAGASFPAVEVGGDFFDYISMPDGQLAIAIGDVSSHGLGPALMMAQTRAYLRALMLTRNDVGEVLQLANQALCLDASDGRFVTLLLASVGPKTGGLLYASAGHLPGYILGEEGTVRHELWSTGIPLGVEADTSFPKSEMIEMQPGDVALFMTDGIVEAADRQRARFGIERALETIRLHQHLPAAQIVAALHEAVQQFHRGTPEDDLTAVVVKRVP